MEISSIQSAQPPSDTSSSATNSATELGKDDFLKLLVKQLEYQDPMNPVSNEEFIAQTAQFSSLEQMQNLNVSMESLMELERTSGNAALVSYVGKAVEVPGSSTELANGSAELGVRLAEPSWVTLEIRDGNGQLVRTIESDELLPTDDYKFVWNGEDDQGELLPDGLYAFTPIAVNGDGDVTVSEPFVTGKVSAILYEDGGTRFVVNGEKIDPADIRAVQDR